LNETNILERFGKANTAFLHARGWISTKFLIQKLDCQANERILEIGFGTGATLVELASRNKRSSFFGIEAHQLMYEKAVDRIRFCGLSKKIECSLNTNISKLPFPDSSFDKVYCESVLAILQGNDLPNTLQEVNRILKPEGILLFNETIWVSNASKEMINEINTLCKLNYGIIQSSSDFPYVQDWKRLLQSSGFEILDVFKVDEIDDNLNVRKNWQSILSDLFSDLGRLKKGPKSTEFDSITAHLKIPEKIMEGMIIRSKSIKTE
jgi:ubiquinone/menaquinone biosynthesis C-methylase UbiE